MCIFEYPLSDLGAMHVLQLRFVGKPIVNFLLAVIEHFLLAVMIAAIWACISQNGTAVIFSLYSNRQMALRQKCCQSNGWRDAELSRIERSDYKVFGCIEYSSDNKLVDDRLVNAIVVD